MCRRFESVPRDQNLSPLNMEQTIEQRVAQAALQLPTQVVVGDRTFNVAPPTIKTLILASAAISTLPQCELNSKHVIEESLFIAKDCAPLGDVAAILILGAKGLKEPYTYKQKRRRRGFLGLLGFKDTVTVHDEIDKQAELAKFLLENLSPQQLRDLLKKLISQLQLGDFFGLTTFLIDLNLLRPTKVEETTAFGQ